MKVVFSVAVIGFVVVAILVVVTLVLRSVSSVVVVVNFIVGTTGESVDTDDPKQNKLIEFFIYLVGPSLSHIRAPIASFVMWGSASWIRGSDLAI